MGLKMEYYHFLKKVSMKTGSGDQKPKILDSP